MSVFILESADPYNCWGDGSTSATALGVTNGQSLYIVVDGNNSSNGTYTLNVGGVCIPNESQACDTGIPGVCAAGTQYCDMAGNWGECFQDIPAGSEICDGLDNNCDGNIDEGLTNTYYRDADEDGYGDPNNTIEACNLPFGYVSDNTDCDDTNPDINPGACDIKKDGIDQDCDGSDRTTGSPCPGSDPEICDDSIDNDGDGDTDCLDSDCSQDPVCAGGDPEICDDGIDNDGDGKIDCADKKDCRDFPGC